MILINTAISTITFISSKASWIKRFKIRKKANLVFLPAIFKLKTYWNFFFSRKKRFLQYSQLKLYSILILIYCHCVCLERFYSTNLLNLIVDTSAQCKYLSGCVLEGVLIVPLMMMEWFATIIDRINTDRNSSRRRRKKKIIQRNVYVGSLFNRYQFHHSNLIQLQR